MNNETKKSLGKVAGTVAVGTIGTVVIDAVTDGIKQTVGIAALLAGCGFLAYKQITKDGVMDDVANTLREKATQIKPKGEEVAKVVNEKVEQAKNIVKEKGAEMYKTVQEKFKQGVQDGKETVVEAEIVND